MYVSEKQYKENVSRLVNMLGEDDIVKDVRRIVAIATGGVVLGTMLMEQLNLPMSIVQAAHYDGKVRTNKALVSVSDEVVDKMRREMSSYGDGYRILLVDDLLHTGDTMIAMRGVLRAQVGGSMNIDSVVMFVKPKSESRISAVHVSIVPDTEWVDFFYD